MRSKNILCASLGFLVVIIAAYFGAAIYNAKVNSPIDYLNEMDHIRHFDKALIPQLNFRAALITFPFLSIIFIIQIIIIAKSKVRQVKNIAIGLTIAVAIILIISLMMMNNPEGFDFSRWGYVWITLGILITGGNVIAAFIIGNRHK